MKEDSEILSLYRAGQEENAFSELVRSYSRKLYFHLRPMAGSHEDTDDLLQETFVKIWKALPSFREESSLSTWIWRIATNEALAFLRKKKVRSFLSFEQITPATKKTILADPYFNGDAAQARLEAGIASLPDKQRAVFCMRYYEELPFEEISRITGTSVGALKASYHIAAEKLRIKITEED